MSETDCKSDTPVCASSGNGPVDEKVFMECLNKFFNNKGATTPTHLPYKTFCMQCNNCLQIANAIHYRKTCRINTLGIQPSVREIINN